MKRWTLISCMVLFTAATAFAQKPEATESPKIQFYAQGLPAQPDVFWYQGPGSPMPEGNVTFRTMHLAGDPEVVRNAPYSATVIDESTQTLADGNHIVNKSTAFVARDGQGRTRREETIKRIGSLQVDAPKLITITDPQSHTNYIVMPDLQLAKPLKNETISIEGPESAKTRVHTFREQRIEQKIKTATAGAAAGSEHEPADLKHEDLGTQEIEGLSCHGIRDTVTVPAGAIGNEKPIVTTNEVWTSTDLHIVVLEKRSDPRFGESTYRLSSISRGEPDPSLFQIPNGYKTLSPSEDFSKE